MLLLLISLLIFIPFANNNYLILQISEEEAENLSYDKDVFVMAFDPRDRDSNIEKIKTIKNMALYFQDIQFSIFDPESAQLLSAEFDMSLPAIFYYENGSLLANYSYPESENMVLHLCNNLFKRQTFSEAISNVDELYASLNSSPFTVLAPSDKYNESFALLNQVGSDFGFINILNVTADLLNQLGVRNDTIGFFRLEDSILISINITKEDLMNASVPLYRIYMSSDLLEQEELVAFFADNLGEEERDFLYNISTSYPNFTFGYGRDIEEYVYSYIPGISGCELHQILVFNYRKQYFYDPTKYFGAFYDDVFNVDTWIVAISSMLDDINNKVLGPSYISEDIPPPENQTTVIQVVGYNYEEFVMDDKHDVIMLYRRSNCPHCQQFYPIYNSFANECNEANLTFLKFGYIDIDYNASPLKFPFMLGVPHVHIFPAHDKANNRSICAGRDRDALIRLISDNSNNSIPFDYPEFDNSKLSNEIFQLFMASSSVDPEDQDRFDHELSFLSNYSPKISKKKLSEENPIEEEEEDELSNKDQL